MQLAVKPLGNKQGKKHTHYCQLQFHQQCSQYNYRMQRSPCM